MFWVESEQDPPSATRPCVYSLENIGKTAWQMKNPSHRCGVTSSTKNRVHFATQAGLMAFSIGMRLWFYAAPRCLGFGSVVLCRGVRQPLTGNILPSLLSKVACQRQTSSPSPNDGSVDVPPHEAILGPNPRCSSSPLYMPDRVK